MYNDNNENEQYSWMREAVADNEHDGERFSEIIVDTVGGRTRAQLAEYQQQQQTQQSRNRNRQNTQLQGLTLPPLASNSAKDYSDGKSKNNKTNHETSGCSSGVISDGDEISAFARLIEKHPQPGDGARRLLQMVQQPFSVKFGALPSERALSSAREIEQQRAGSSSRPPLTPFLKDPELEFFHDSPRAVPHVQSVGTQTQLVSPPPAPRRTHSLSDYPPLYDFSRRPHVRHGSLHSTATPPPTPPITARFYKPPVASSSPNSTTAHRRAHSLSDYPPLYDFSQRPTSYIHRNTLSDCYRKNAQDLNFHRKRFINTLLKEIRKSKELERKLESRQEELDEACKRDANELGNTRRERELLVRELEVQSREYEFEERERNRINSLSRQPLPLRQQPILKHSASFPPNANGGNANNNNRVNFASPICTSKEFTPNNSSSLDLSTRDKNRMPSPLLKDASEGGTIQNQLYQNQNNKSTGSVSRRCHHPLHNRTARIVSTPHHSHRSRTPSPPLARHPDVNRQREQAQQCLSHEAEFRAQQQRVAASAAMTQQRRSRGGMSQYNKNNRSQSPANISSIFHYVPRRAP